MLVRPAAFSLAVSAHVTVRNDARIARAIVPLQVSFSLHWQSASFAGTKLQMEVQSLDTDLDHTSRANEALIHLPNPLAPGASTTLDVFYEGAIPVDATRIEHLGAPRGMAQQEIHHGADGAGHEDGGQAPQAGVHVAALGVAADVAD